MKQMCKKLKSINYTQHFFNIPLIRKFDERASASGQRKKLSLLIVPLTKVLSLVENLSPKRKDYKFGISAI